MDETITELIPHNLCHKEIIENDNSILVTLLCTGKTNKWENEKKMRALPSVQWWKTIRGDSIEETRTHTWPEHDARWTSIFVEIRDVSILHDFPVFFFGSTRRELSRVWCLKSRRKYCVRNNSTKWTVWTGWNAVMHWCRKSLLMWFHRIKMWPNRNGTAHNARRQFVFGRRRVSTNDVFISRLWPLYISHAAFTSLVNRKSE